MHDSPGRNEDAPPEDAGVVPSGPDIDDTGEAATDVRGSRWHWKTAVVVVGGATITVVGTVLATLAATQKTAIHENAVAYMHGMRDGFDAVRNGFDPFETFDD